MHQELEHIFIPPSSEVPTVTHRLFMCQTFIFLHKNVVLSVSTSSNGALEWLNNEANEKTKKNLRHGDRLHSFWGETYRATDDPAQGVPGPFIKPVEELVEAICGEMVRRSVIEPEATEEKEKRAGWV